MASDSFVEYYGNHGIYRSNAANPYWTFFDATAIFLWFNDLQLGPSGSDYRSYGFPVRCLVY